MNKSQFFYNLPQTLIAQEPTSRRDCSRLLAYNKKTESISNHTFSDISNFLNPHDVLVINNSKVIPARLYGKNSKGKNVEVLLVKKTNDNLWEALVKPGRQVKVGEKLFFAEELKASVIDINPIFGTRFLDFECKTNFYDVLNKIGNIPLPPYITEKINDFNKYQTIYAQTEGSVAAPTAGLHFSPELLNTLKEKNVIIAELTLHVGLGTFRPVKENIITNHKIHSEYFQVSDNTAKIINEAKKEKRRIIGVGTTTVRALESIANDKGYINSYEGETDIFIYPPYQFKTIDALITNFHLPESTLLMLIASFIGIKKTIEIYNYAIKNEYRFYSFGDAMFIY